MMMMMTKMLRLAVCVSAMWVLKMKWQGHEVDHFYPSNAEVKNG
jgi:hypothetical protein